MSVFVRIILPLALVLVVLLGTALLLQACGVVLWGTTALARYCPIPVSVTDRGRLDELRSEGASLRSRIAFLEQELAARQCTVVFDDPPLAPVPPETAIQPPLIDRDAWERGDLDALTGCWDLEAQMRVRNVRTNRITLYNQWNICFDGNGQGTEKMRATDGTTCEGPVSGSFDPSGRLIIEEPGNLSCSNDGWIFRRVASCTLQSDARATCSVFQPEPNITSTVRLQRAAGGQ
ncbi:hypothetical protein ABIE69_002115 [Rhodobacteraceae bacterium MBR-64]|jgi:hypothetical protein